MRNSRRARRGARLATAALAGAGLVIPVALVAPRADGATTAAAASWPELGYSPALQSTNPNEHTITTANVHGLTLESHSGIDYNSEFGGGQDGSPVEGDGMVFVGTLNHHLVAYHASNGAQAWIQPPGGGNTSFNGAPAYSNGLVYVQDPSGELYAFHAATGVRAWHTGDLGTGQVNGNGLTVADDVVLAPMQYIDAAGGGLEAFNAATGKRLWAWVDTGYSVNSTASVWGNRVFITASKAAGGQVAALWLTGPLAGKVDWKKATSTPPTGSASPIVVGTDVVVPLAKGTKSVLGWFSQVTGAELQSAPTLSGTQYGMLALNNGLLIVGTSTDVYAVSTKTRLPAWTHALAARAVGGVSVADGVVFLAEQTNPTGTVLALSEAKGTQLWSGATIAGNSSNSAPIIVNGQVYVTDFPEGFSNDDGYLDRYGL